MMTITLFGMEITVFALVAIGVPLLVLIVAALVVNHSIKQVKAGNLTPIEEHEGIIQRLYANGESRETVMHLASTRVSKKH